jgi:hypothetical protein
MYLVPATSSICRIVSVRSRNPVAELLAKVVGNPRSRILRNTSISRSCCCHALSGTPRRAVQSKMHTENRFCLYGWLIDVPQSLAPCRWSCQILCLEDIDTHPARELKHLDEATMSRLQISAFVKLKSSFQKSRVPIVACCPSTWFQGV